ncbi:hypothetical protein C8J56DRAFT_892164 [Mycena floridula]|nr:hypothetical protein C8J56DRAFT_892164 [Mycena floridula]
MHFNLLFNLVLVAAVVALPVPSKPEPAQASQPPALSAQDTTDIAAARSQCLGFKSGKKSPSETCMRNQGFEKVPGGKGWRRPVYQGPVRVTRRAEDSLELEAREELELGVLFRLGSAVTAEITLPRE